MFAGFLQFGSEGLSGGVAFLSGLARSARVRLVPLCLFMAVSALAVEVGSPPTIALPPIPQKVHEVGGILLTVGAHGAGPFTYQWRRAGLPVPDATWADLALANISPLSAGEYDVVVTNPTGSTTSKAATVEVKPLVVNEPERVVGSLWSSYRVQIGASGAWSASSDASWLTLVNTSGVGTGVLEIEISQNTTGSERTASVQINDEVHTVRQLPAHATGDHLWVLGYAGFGRPSIVNRPEASEITGAKSVHFGYTHMVVLKADDTLWSTGQNRHGQLGDGSKIHRDELVQIAAGIKRAEANGYTTLYIDERATLWGAGRNADGELGLGDVAEAKTPTRLMGNVAAVAGGGSYTLVLTTTGELWATGLNSYGQFGDGTKTSVKTFKLLRAGVLAMAGDSQYAAWITADNVLWAAGSNSNGIFGTLTGEQLNPVQVATGVDGLHAGPRTLYFRKTDGSYWGVGANDGVLGNGGTSSAKVPVLIETDIIDVAADYSTLHFVKSDGTLWATGRNDYGQLGDGTITSRLSPIQIGSGFASVATTGSYSAFVAQDGRIYFTGDRYGRNWGDRSLRGRAFPFLIATGVTSANVEPSAFSYVKADGGFWRASFGEGNPSDPRLAARPFPTKRAEGVTMASGTYHTLFVRSNGELWGAGSNWMGQLGDGSTDDRSPPVFIAHNVVQASAGYVHSLFVRKDGQLWGMGTNRSGQLGVASSGDGKAPIFIAANVATAVAQDERSFYITTDGLLYAMGDNSSGQLGDGFTTERRTPVLIATDVAYLSASGSHTIFVKIDGTLWGMGLTDSGQLGRTGAPVLSPVQIASGVVDAAAGSETTYYIDGGGVLWFLGADPRERRFDNGPSPIGVSSPERLAQRVKRVFAGGTAVAMITHPDARFPGLEISRSPVGGTVVEGETHTLTAAHRGGPASYRWYKDGEEIPGATGPELILSGLRLDDSGEYIVEIVMPFGSLTPSPNPPVPEFISGWRYSPDIDPGYSTSTEPVTLKVLPLPVITQQPQTVRTNLGSPAQLTVMGRAHAGTLIYQWRRNGSPISGATGSSLSLASVSLGDLGRYDVIVTDDHGSRISEVARVVLPERRADFDGDGRPDILWTDLSQGSSGVWTSPDGSGAYQENGLVGGGVGWRAAAAADFDGDGKIDLVYENERTGQRLIWRMNGIQRAGDPIPLPAVNNEWSIAGAGDFDGDGDPDLVWQNLATGERGVWFLEGTEHKGIYRSLGQVSAEWIIVGVADFNRDGSPDLFWRNTATWEMAIWLLDGLTYLASVPLPAVEPRWQVAQVDDFNNDGIPDVLWQNRTTGDIGYWPLTGSGVSGVYVHMGQRGLPWLAGTSLQLVPKVGRVRGDVNGDGQPDVAWSHSIEGRQVIWYLDRGIYKESLVLPAMSPGWMIKGLDDLSGDGDADVLWENIVTGERRIGFMQQGVEVGVQSLGVFDLKWKSFSGDLDGDGHTDLLWQNAETGEVVAWLLINSGFREARSLGQAPGWDLAATGDLDRDGKVDLLWENRTTGERYAWMMDRLVFREGKRLGSAPPTWRIVGSVDFTGDGESDLLWQNVLTGERVVWELNRGNLVRVAPFVTVDPAWQLRH